MKKYFINFLIFVGFLGLLLLGLAFYYQKNHNLEITVFNVGQGDSIFIKTPKNQKILIDGGPDNTILSKLGEELPFYDKDLDWIVSTHPHADHLAGLISVMKRYNVKNILFTGVVHTTDEYLEFLKILKEKQIPVKIAFSDLHFDFDDNAKLEILYPLESLQGKSFKDLNESSIVLKLRYKNISFLLAGDANSKIEEKLLSKNINLKADILKVAHQGSKTASSLKFLQAVNPELAIISVGKNKFGHPHKETLIRLAEQHIKVLRTDQEGDIKIVSDGQNFWKK